MSRLSIVILAILICIAAFTSVAAWRSPLLQVVFLDVGNGDAILVTSPSGNSMLIDGGPDQSVLQALGRILPFYDRSLDIVLATSQKSTDTGGLPFVFDRFNVGAFMDSGLSANTATYRTLLDDVARENVPHITAQVGMSIDLGDGASFLVLSSGAEITGKIIYENTSISIPGDILDMASSTSDIVLESDGVNVVRK